MYLTVWGSIGIANYIIYFFNWIKPPYHPSIFYIIEHPINGIEYFIANVGSPLGSDPVSAMSTGLIIVGILLYLAFFLLKYKLVKQNAIWLSLIFFSLGSSLLMTIGRSGFGVVQGITSRYVSFTVIGIIGLYLLTLAIQSTINDEKWKFSFFLGIVVGIIIFGIICGSMTGLQSAENLKNDQKQLVSYLIGYSTASDEQLQRLYPDPSVVRERAKFVENHHFNVFYSSDNEYILNKSVPIKILSGQSFFYWIG
jgi:hypothetical protein